MNNPPPASPTGGSIDPKAVDGMQALRTGLELTRASQLTLLRLQLALYKSNRRTAMQALDTLLDIDAEMEDLAATLTNAPMPRVADEATLPGFIGRQRAAIAIEKHALTGGQGQNDVRSLAIAPADDWTGDAGVSAQPPLAEEEAESEESAPRRRWVRVLAAVTVIVAIGCGLTAYLWPDVPAAILSS
ncbi:MAG TPA: hypothetical protein VNZ43_15845 [Sphingomonadaceae bacterium]|nr:hypothetical protein [Sphingomonadaceae bacterium]